MSINWTWPKLTGLVTVQAAAHTAIGLLTANGIDALHLNLAQIGASSGLAAAVAFLGMVVAYHMPGQVATEIVSAPMAAHQFSVADADEGRHVR